MERVKNYMTRLKNATGTKLIESDGLYSGLEGHLRFAREIGVVLSDFSKEEQKYLLDNSYNFYVALTSIKPLLNLKEWLEAIDIGKKKTIYNGERLYDEIELLSEVGNIYWRVKLDFQDLKLTKEETIEMYDEIIKDYNIKNIIDFREKMEKIETELKKIESESPRNNYHNCH